MKIIEVIEKIKNEHEPFIENQNCRDCILAGNPNQVCTGICITVCATMNVLKQAIDQKCNLIISHESIFYGSQRKDENTMDNEVAEVKRRYIEENHLVVWRNHDRIHGNVFSEGERRINRDHIFYGICKELGWEKYVLDDPLKPCWYQIPEIDAETLANQLIGQFKLSGMRVSGSLNGKVSKIWFCEHVNGTKKDAFKLLLAEKADAIIPLEICDSTLTQYVRDANTCGIFKVLFEIGHFNCEEIGMKYFKDWLIEIFNENINVEFIQSGDVFQYLGGK